MRLDNFDLNLLVVFDILLEERSVTRAARRLNVTQPAISSALKRLRESFQDELLVLHGKKMIPTQHALNLAPEISAELVRLKSLLATSTRFDPATSRRRFQINASDYITTVLLVPLIEALQNEAPGIRLNLSLPGSDSSDRLEAGEIDLILTPDEFMQGDHPRELLFEERHVIVGWKDNPLLEGELSLEEFLTCGQVIVQISGQDTFVEASLRKRFPDRCIEVAAQSFIQVPWLLRGTQRISVMHERLAKMMAPALDLRIADLPLDVPLMREMMQYHSTREQDAGLTWLRARIKQLAALS